MECIICWDSILSLDADTFCAQKTHTMCVPCFFYMRRLKRDLCPVCRGKEGGSQSALTKRLEAVLAAIAAVEEKQEHLNRVRQGICESISRLILSLYMCMTVFMIAVALHVAVAIHF